MNRVLILLLSLVCVCMIWYPILLPNTRCPEELPLSKHVSLPRLKLNKRDQFRIAIFSDLHYGEEEHGWGVDQDIKSTRVIRKVLDLEKPDLVVLNGDLITGENTFLHNATKYLNTIVKPMVQFGIPWASTYGNHDEQFNLSREDLFLEEFKYNLSYTSHSPPGVPGVTNFFLPIFRNEHDDNPALLLWFFDSRGGQQFQKRQKPHAVPDWVSASVADWMQRSQSSMKKKWGHLPPSIAFVHIPPTAFLVSQVNMEQDSERAHHYPGINDDVPLDNEGDNGQDEPFMKALINTPGLHSVYSGHDHGDSWCTNWPGMGDTKEVSRPHLCFCKHTGYGGYGYWKRGSRVVELSFEANDGDVDVQTWVRMEDGNVIQRVSLNETYGQDIYLSCNGEDNSCQLP